MGARKAAKDREKDILNAAIKVFSERSYNAATTSEIAKEAGVAEGTIFKYFKNKKELLNKVMIELITVFGNKFIISRLNRVIEENKGKSEREILKSIFMDRIDLIEKNQDIIKIIITEIQYQEDLREAFIKNIIMTGKDIITQFIENGIMNKTFREVNVHIAARSLVGMVAMYVMQSKLAPEVISIDKEKQVEEIVDLFLYGISKK